MSRDERENRIRDEIDFHLEAEQAEWEAAGLPPDDARQAAYRDLGSRALIHEAMREAWGRGLLESFFRDVRYSGRRLWTHRAFAGMAILTLAVSIAAATAVYSFVDQVLFRPPRGVAAPHEVVQVYLYDRTRPNSFSGLSLYHYNELTAAQTPFSDLMGYFPFEAVLASGTAAEQATVDFVTGNFFSGLGIPMIAGRGIEPSDNVPNGPRSVVLSEHTWQRQFAGARDVIGRSVTLNGNGFTVVGIASDEFEGIVYSGYGRPDLWTAIHAYTPILGTDRITRRIGLFSGLGRLKRGVDQPTAEAALTSTVARLSYVPTDSTHFNAAALFPIGRTDYPWSHQVLGKFLGVLLAVSILILLATCTNIANFLISHGITRRAELSIRLALGASRSRLLSQLLTESLVLGTLAGGAGVLMSVFLVRLLEAYPPMVTAGYAFRLPIHLGLATWLFGTGATIAAIVIFGLLPAVLASNRSPLTTLRRDGRWTASLRLVTPRHVLLAVQVAVSVVLAITAALYARNLATIDGVAYTLSTEGILLARVAPSTLPAGQRTLFWQQLMTKLRTHPLVESAAVASNPPLSIGGSRVQSSPTSPPTWADFAFVGPSYFRTLSIPLIAGRELQDVNMKGRVALITQTLGDELWPGRDAIGQEIWLQLPAPTGGAPFTVIGVVNQPRCQDLLDAPRGCVYLPLNYERPFGILHVRTRSTPMAFLPMLRHFVSDLSPDVPLDRISSLEEHIRTVRAAPRISAFMTASLAVLTAILVVVGCVGLLASLVNEGRREIAIRLALGSTATHLVARIVGLAMVPYVAGIGVGTLVSWWLATKFLAAQLYHTSASDPYAFVLTPGIFVVVGFLASYWPARAATRTDPSVMLRYE